MGYKFDGGSIPFVNMSFSLTFSNRAQVVLLVQRRKQVSHNLTGGLVQLVQL